MLAGDTANSSFPNRRWYLYYFFFCDFLVRSYIQFILHCVLVVSKTIVNIRLLGLNYIVIDKEVLK